MRPGRMMVQAFDEQTKVLRAFRVKSFMLPHPSLLERLGYDCFIELGLRAWHIVCVDMVRVLDVGKEDLT